MSEFGSLVSEHRERLGLSNARLAELVGRAPSTVRSWERGRSTPDDPIVVTSLAAVLGIDENDLFRAANMTPPAEAAPFTLEETLSSIAPGGETRPVAIPDRVVDDDVPPRSRQRADRQSALDKLRAAVDAVAEGGSPTVPARRRSSFGRERRRPFAALSYMEDVEQRWGYRIRGALTAVGVGVLGVVLLWAGSELLSALGDVWDALTAGL